MIRVKIVFEDDIILPREVIEKLMKAKVRVILEKDNINGYSGKPFIAVTYGSLGTPPGYPMQKLGSIAVTMKDEADEFEDVQHPLSRSRRYIWRS